MYCYRFFSVVFVAAALFSSTRFACAEEQSKNMYSELLINYQKHLQSHPVQYSFIGKEKLKGLEIRTYRLTSQDWSPQSLVAPERWEHTVTILIPKKPNTGRALVVINNGLNHNLDGKPPLDPTDFNLDTLKTLANATNTIVVSISDIPNQYLTFNVGDQKPCKEDDAVAQTWALFLKNPQKDYSLPLQLPMTAAVSQALNLAEQELNAWKIHNFIVTGLSKRGCIAWLTAISDPRVEAIVPFVYDMLNMQETLRHMCLVYGGNWPLAFYPYYKEGLDLFFGKASFDDLTRIIDPMQYIFANVGYPLTIPKYIVNASGDDFFVPDNAANYFSCLPGTKMLRVLPNASHYAASSFTASTLVPFVKRLQKNMKLPQARVEYKNGELRVFFSQTPKEIKQWTAHNPRARDFRYACGIRYSAKKLKAPPRGKPLKVSLTTPKEGWQATFIEAVFSDGFVVTTPVYVEPRTYPDQPPPQGGEDSGCKTLPGRNGKGCGG